jgi:clan AA aspartic protease
MGLTMVKVKLTNFVDRVRADEGEIPEGSVRSLEIEALADTGAIAMAIPEDIAKALGVQITGSERVRVADGRSITVQRARGLIIEVLGRWVQGEALVLPEGATPLLGAVQLELMDFVVVPSTGEVIPNPAHPDGPVLPMLLAGRVPSRALGAPSDHLPAPVDSDVRDRVAARCAAPPRPDDHFGNR